MAAKKKSNKRGATSKSKSLKRKTSQSDVLLKDLRELIAEARALAAELAAKPPVSLRFIIEAVNRGMDLSLREGSRIEASLFGLVAATDDMREGTAAFLEKRSAQFTGR